MEQLLPDGEELRRAVSWMATRLKEEGDEKLSCLLQEATFTFNLSPRDAEWLGAFYREAMTRQKRAAS